jgi:hypothetical protein
MSALFRPRSDTIFRLVLFLLVIGGAATITWFMVYARTPYGQRRQDPVIQPIQFDHRHHIVDDGIDCRYCHNTVDRGPSAGLPPTELCLGCHSQIWNKSPLLDQVRESWFTGRPIRWVRVHILPQFVYFDHSIHVAKGIGCESCHGRVDQMAAIEQVAPLTMGWCLECHRNPVPSLRPQSAITTMGWQPKGDPAALGRELRQKYETKTRTSCTTCHR